MAESIKTITDTTRYEGIFKNYFAGKEVFIKTKSGDLNIRFVGFSGNNVAFLIPHVKNMRDSITIFTRHQSNTIYALLKFLERNEDTFIFLPEKIQVISQERREDRKLVGTEAGVTVIYLNNVMTDFLIKTEMTMQVKKVDHIKEIISFDLKKQFDNIKIYFISEGKNDLRMKSLLLKGSPIFVPDLNSDPEPKYAKDHNFYINEIYSRDFRLSKQKEFISEICVPIYYRAVIPYGYLQLNNKASMTDGLYTVGKRTAIIVNELCNKNKLIAPTDDKFLVSDLSSKGLSLVFKNRRQTRFFQKDSMIIFDMMLPTQKKVTVGAIVRNINFLENSIIKVGMEIVNLDALSEVNYEEYIGSLT